MESFPMQGRPAVQYSPTMRSPIPRSRIGSTTRTAALEGAGRFSEAESRAKGAAFGGVVLAGRPREERIPQALSWFAGRGKRESLDLDKKRGTRARQGGGGGTMRGEKNQDRHVLRGDSKAATHSPEKPSKKGDRPARKNVRIPKDGSLPELPWVPHRSRAEKMSG